MPLRVQLKAASGAFSPMSDGDTARETVGPISRRDPEAWCSERGHYRPERSNPGVPGRGHYRAKRPRPGVHGRGHYRPERPRPGVLRRGHYRPSFLARLPTAWHRRRLILLSNTPQIMWCCSGSPVLFFAVVAFVVYRRRRVIFLRGAVYDVSMARRFKDHCVVEFIMSPDPSAHERGGRGVRKL